MPAGRKRKPTKIHQLHGAKDKLRQRKNEAETEVTIPPKPKFLSKEASAEWNFIAEKLEELGMIAEIDRAALAAYCQAFGRWAQVEQVLKKQGVFYRKKVLNPETNRMIYSGELVVNPLIYVANKSMDQIRRFLIEFGMTPSSRSKVIADKHKKTTNEYEKWKKRNKKKGYS